MNEGVLRRAKHQQKIEGQLPFEGHKSEDSGWTTSSNPPSSLWDLLLILNSFGRGQRLQCYNLGHLIALAKNREHGQPPKNSYYRTHSPGGMKMDLVLWEWGKGNLEVTLITALVF